MPDQGRVDRGVRVGAAGRWPRLLPEWLTWTALGVAVWLATTSGVTVPEVVAAAAAAGGCAVWVMIARRVLRVAPGRPVLPASAVPAAAAHVVGGVLGGTVRLGIAVLARLTGRRGPRAGLLRLRHPDGAGRPAVLARVNATPSTIALGPTADGELLVHALPPDPAALVGVVGPGAEVVEVVGVGDGGAGPHRGSG